MTTNDQGCPSQNANCLVLDDLNNNISESDIIHKLQNSSDMMRVLWETGDTGQYVPLHHASSHGKIELLHFILDIVMDEKA